MNEKFIHFGILAIAGIAMTLLIVNKVNDRKVFIDKDKQHGNLYRVIPNRGGGDCLFYSFINALPGNQFTVYQLRKVVADYLNDEHFKSLSDIYNMAKEERDYQLLRDYSFMKGVNDLTDLRSSVMKSTYYGDELALSALEKWSGIRPIVLTPKKSGNGLEVSARIEDKEPPRSNAYLLLLLRNVHYENIEYKGKLLMKIDELPDGILTF